MFRLRLPFAVASLVLLACSDDTGPTSSSSGGETTSGAGGATSASTSTGIDPTTSSSGTGGEGGEGGGGGSLPTTGVPGTDLVNAGKVMTSPNYRAIVTIGQSSPAQERHGSPNHTLRGGVVGATQ
jgi:hypothetical protein